MEMQDTTNVKDIVQLKTKIRHWQILAFSSLIIILLIISCMLFVLNKHGKDTNVIGSYDFMPINATSSPFDKNLLPHFQSATNEFTANLQIVLASKEFLRYSFFSHPISDGIRFDSERKDAQIQIIFPPFSQIKRNTKFCIEGLFRKSPDFRGDVFLKVLISRKGEKSFETLFTKPPNPNLTRKGGWIVAKKTFTVDGDIDKIQCVLSATFEGSIEIGSIELQKIPNNKD
jgi:hypothetical protein